MSQKKNTIEEQSINDNNYKKQLLRLEIDNNISKLGIKPDKLRFRG